MGIEYEIECNLLDNLTEEALRTLLGVNRLDNDDFTVELMEDARIYFCQHIRSDNSRIAFAKLIELTLSTNDAVIIREI